MAWKGGIDQLLRRAVVANALSAHAQAKVQLALGFSALRQEVRSEARQALAVAPDDLIATINLAQACWS